MKKIYIIKDLIAEQYWTGKSWSNSIRNAKEFIYDLDVNSEMNTDEHFKYSYYQIIEIYKP